jgi:hypothetical protein
MPIPFCLLLLKSALQLQRCLDQKESGGTGQATDSYGCPRQRRYRGHHSLPPEQINLFARTPAQKRAKSWIPPRIRSPGSKHFGSHPHALHAHGHRNCPIPGRCGPPENPRGHAFPGGSTVGTGRECARAGASCWGRGPPAAGNWSRLRAVHPAVFCAWCLCGAGSSASAGGVGLPPARCRWGGAFENKRTAASRHVMPCAASTTGGPPTHSRPLLPVRQPCHGIASLRHQRLGRYWKGTTTLFS